MKAMRILTIIALALLLGLAAGCGWIRTLGSGSRSGVDTLDTPAQVLANEAETSYREGKFDEAADLYQQLKDRFPYSRYALLADLRVGDAYFEAKRFDEAVLAYDDFVRLHPKNEAVPYALFKLGMVHHNQMLTPDRDPSNARKAMEAFQRLLNSYPKSEWAQKAYPRYKEAVARAAGHDMAVGNFYLNTKRYEAAINRFKRVLTQYPDVGLYGEAMDKIEKAQTALASLTPEERQARKEGIDRRDVLVAPPNVEQPGVVFEGEKGSPF